LIDENTDILNKNVNQCPDGPFVYQETEQVTSLDNFKTKKINIEIKKLDLIKIKCKYLEPISNLPTNITHLTTTD